MARSLLLLSLLLSLPLMLGCGGEEAAGKPEADAAAVADKPDAPKNVKGTTRATEDKPAATADAAVDTSLMVDDFQVALVARPSEVLADQLVVDTMKALPEEAVAEMRESFTSESGLELEDVASVQVMMGMPAAETGGQPAFGMMVKFKRPFPQENLDKIFANTEESEHNGKSYHVRNYAALVVPEGVEFDPPPARAYFVSPDRKTMLMSFESSMKKMLDGKGSDTALGKLAAGADYSGDATVLAVLEPIRPMAAMFKNSPDAEQMPPMLLNVIGLADKVDTAVVQVNISEGPFVEGQLVGVNEAAAGEVKGMLEALALVGNQFLGMAKTQIPPEQRAEFEPGVKLAEELLGSFKVTANGTSVAVVLPRPANFNERFGPIRDNAVKAAEEAAKASRSMNNIKQIMLALLINENARGSFPPQAANGLSWRVQILPFIEQAQLYEQFKLDEPWDSEHNKALIEKMPAIFATTELPPGMTNIQAVVGEGSAWESAKGLRIAEIRDGTSWTVMLVETSPEKAVPWTKPDDYQWDREAPAAGLGLAEAAEFKAGFADGSVRSISKTVDGETLNALFTRAGGEVIDGEKLE